MGAPERIWLDWPGANKGEPVYDEPPEREEQAGQIGYIRLDAHTAALAAARAEGMLAAAEMIVPEDVYCDCDVCEALRDAYADIRRAAIPGGAL